MRIFVNMTNIGIQIGRKNVGVRLGSQRSNPFDLKHRQVQLIAVR